MSVNRDPILKRCRSLQIDPSHMGIFKESKRTPSRNTRKMSEYGLQLREKQRAKFIYGVQEKQFRNTFDKAAKKKGITGENLLIMLEERLDNVVYRMGLAMTRREARQLVVHAHFTVNGKKVNIPSYQVKPGDVISVREGSRNMKSIAEALEANITAPAFIEVDKENKKGTFVRLPERSELNQEINESLVVEYYNR